MRSHFLRWYFGAFLLLVVIAVVVSFYFFRNHSKRPDKNIHISYSYTIQNASNLPVKNTRIILPAPISTSSFHQCLKIRSGYSHQLEVTDNGHQTMVFSWDIFPPLTTKVVSVQGDIQLWHMPRKTKIKNCDQYLHAEPYIESDSAAIKELASHLQSEKILHMVRTIYEWVAENVQYTGYVRQWRGALYALRHQKGDCSEYACLFVALCRSNSIPARVLGGYVCPKSMVLDLGDYHNWAEFYFKGRWYIADPQKRAFMPTSAAYVPFQIVQPSSGTTDTMRPKIQGKRLNVRFNS